MLFANDTISQKMETVEIDVNVEAYSDRNDKLNDPLMSLHCIEDEPWDSLSLTNPQLHKEMWNVAHGQTWNMMAIKWMEANVASPAYQSMYC